MPALLTSTVTGPKASSAAATAASQASSSVTSRCAEAAASPSDSAATASTSSARTSASTTGALGREQPGLGLALAPGRAGDDGDLAVESSHLLILRRRSYGASSLGVGI